MIDLAIPEKHLDVIGGRGRYKVLYGGRGGAKTWSFARGALLRAHNGRERILCAREFQTSIADSVHRTLFEQIIDSGLLEHFSVQQKTIIAKRTGSEFIFKGLHHNIGEIKSLEGATICWVEEAQAVSEESWKVLIPTLRRQDSEFWIGFNPDSADDPTYKRFVIHPPPRSLIAKVGWQDNPRFPQTLDMERRYMLEVDPEAYDHIWEGECRSIGAAAIFKGKCKFEAFETPEFIKLTTGNRFWFGADWGFALSPTCLIRSFIDNDNLFIDHEAYGYGTELDKIPDLFDTVPGSRFWPIKGDAARPETISYMSARGFPITAAEKWQGSVEDGIEHLRGFRNIYIHPRCPQMSQEARLYSFKVDKRTEEILPVPEDRHNHGWDAVRYSLDGYIQRRGIRDQGYWARFLGRSV